MWLPTVNRLPDSNSIFSSLWLTDDTGMWFLSRNLPLPWSQSLSFPPSLPLSLPLSSLSIIVSLDRMKSCFDSGYCATGIWELFFLVWIAQSCCQPSAAERPPHSSLEINSSRNFRGPGRPDMKRRWYLWYGMLSRNLYIKPKHPRPHYWPRTKPLTKH